VWSDSYAASTVATTRRPYATSTAGGTAMAR
jgi:hypothetical protein